MLQGIVGSAISMVLVVIYLVLSSYLDKVGWSMSLIMLADMTRLYNGLQLNLMTNVIIFGCVYMLSKVKRMWYM